MTSRAVVLANLASSNILEVDSTTDRVGIGSTQPTTRLDVSGNIKAVHGNFTGVVTATSGTFNGPVTIGGTLTYEDVTNIDVVGIITARSDVSIADKIVHTGDTNTAIRFPAADTFAVETAGSERLRVTSTGDLDFKSADGVGINFRESGYINIDSDNDDSSRNFTFYDAKGTGSEKHLMILTDTGNVGIATNNTTYANSNANDLVIGSSSSSTERGITLGSSVASAIRFADAGNSSAGMIQYVHNAGGTDYMNFYTAATERMRITSAGLVGLGTVSPSINDGTGLHIAGTSAGIKLQNLNNSDWAFIEYADESNTTKFIQGYRDQSGMYAIRPGTSLNATPGITLNSTGEVGINDSSPSTKLDITGPGTSEGVTLRLNDQAALAASRHIQLARSSASAYIGIRGDEPGDPMFLTRSTSNEDLTIMSAGDVGIATHASINAGKLSILFDGTTKNGASIKTTRDSNNSAFLNFIDSSGSSIGSVQQNTATTVNYVTTSDYRLKENVVEISDGISRVKQLKPSRFNFIADSTTIVDGFLAHEAQTVVPEAVVGEKDGESMQGIDQSKLVPLLTAAIKELIAEIESLKTRVAALESS